jgi:hypothetical protein
LTGSTTAVQIGGVEKKSPHDNVREKRGGGVRRKRRQKAVVLAKGVYRIDDFVVFGQTVSRTATTDTALDSSKRLDLFNASRP